MKNIFLIAVIMLVGGFAMAKQTVTNEVKELFGTCTYTIATNHYDPITGEYSHTTYNTYTTTAFSSEHCRRKAQQHVDQLNGIY